MENRFMKIFTMVFLMMMTLQIHAQLSRSAYVVNTLGEDLTVIDLKNQVVRSPSIPLGYLPNSVKIRNEKAYSVISGSNEIHILNLQTLIPAGTISLSAGTNPYDIDFINDSIAVVSQLFANQVAFVNVNTRNVSRTVDVGMGPQGVKYFEGRLYVANSGFNGSGYDPGKISVIDLTDYSVSFIPVALNPQSLDVDGNGHIIVTCSGDYNSVSAQLDIIDPDSASVIFSQPLAIPVTNIFINASNKAFLATYISRVMVYDLSRRQFIRDQDDALPGGPGVAFDALDNAYICHFDEDSVYAYSPAYEKIGGFQVGDGPVSIAVYDPAFSVLKAEDANLPEQLDVSPNFPNPFNPSTTIEFRLRDIQKVSLEILDIKGSLIRELVNGVLSAGSHRISWDGRNSAGKTVASGIYFYRIRASQHVKTGKMNLIR